MSPEDFTGRYQVPGSTTAVSQDATHPTALPFGPLAGLVIGTVRAETATKGWAISPYGQRQRAQTGRQEPGLLWVPLGSGGNEPSPPTQTSVLPNVGSGPTFLRIALVGMAGSIVHTRVLWLPQSGPRPYMVHCVEGAPEWSRLGVGTGMNLTRRRSQFPFYKMSSAEGRQ